MNTLDGVGADRAIAFALNLPENQIALVWGDGEFGSLSWGGHQSASLVKCFRLVDGDVWDYEMKRSTLRRGAVMVEVFVEVRRSMRPKP